MYCLTKSIHQVIVGKRFQQISSKSQQFLAKTSLRIPVNINGIRKMIVLYRACHKTTNMSMGIITALETPATASNYFIFFVLLHSTIESNHGWHVSSNFYMRNGSTEWNQNAQYCFKFGGVYEVYIGEWLPRQSWIFEYRITLNEPHIIGLCSVMALYHPHAQWSARIRT